jgi:Protein of unknown function (DUF1553)/Protein of unknown function (DUF1549)/Planctomycete cytochrome C
MITTLAMRLIALSCLFACSPAFAADPAEVTFERDVRPILREYCFDCHGATEDKKGNLDLRLVRFMVAGGDSGNVLVVGKPDESLLIERVAANEMPPGEAHLPAEKLETLRRWIAAGAKTQRVEPEQIGPGIPITLEDRSYWAFRPIIRPQVDSSTADRARTPIDTLLLQAMPMGLSFSPDAERSVLIRRLYFDLIGLPPTHAEFTHWNSSTDANWYEQLVESLLESPHYGERWGRHWLDVAGYAESEGQTAQDAERPWAWKYRDYVIRSFNSNKPFDRFITEQLAGDELAGSKQGDWTAEQIELLTATGFLRMAADGTGSGDNSPEARNKVIADTLKIVSSSLLGVSVGCAQCHDHRYDPISHLDYYALRAIFEPAFDWQNWRIPEQRRVSLYTAAERESAAAIDQAAQQVADERGKKEAEFMVQALEKELMKYEEPLRTQLQVAYKSAEKDRTAEQTQLLKQNPSVNISPGVLYQYLPAAAEELKKLDAKIAEIRARKPKEEFVQALTEQPDRIPDTLLFHRGEHQQPKQKVLPSDLTIAAPEGGLPTIPERDANLPTSGRRLTYARWLTGGQHPLVARVLVNRVWLHHFGQAIVATPSEFGKLGVNPTHPELLDWLADEFMRSGWDMKQLHRLILASTAWRQSSVRDPAKVAIDAENKFYWHKSLQRLDAEVLRDRMLFASGTLERDLFGASVAIKEDETGQVIVDGQQKRRSIYVRVRRSQPVAMLQSFDAPVMDVNCDRRPVSTVATQSLILMNGEFTLQQADLLAARVIREANEHNQLALQGMPQLPKPLPPEWTFGYGTLDDATQRVTDFKALPHWTGSEWQGSSARPDPTIGWVILNANGGHPGGKFAAIRRWTAPIELKLNLAGKMQHSADSGDGVRGRIVSDRQGLLGNWECYNTAIETEVNAIEVAAGETIDFVTDCRTTENADSFVWNVTLRIEGGPGVALRERDSAKDFHGPVGQEDFDALPAQLQYAWQLALCRQPTEDELRLSLEYAANQLLALQIDPSGIAAGSTASKQLLVNYCHALMNANEFVYAD